MVIATPDGQYGKATPYAGHPAILKVLAAKRALNFLRLHLLNGPQHLLNGPQPG